MNLQNLGELIKNVLVDMAMNDSLPLDMTLLDMDTVFERAGINQVDQGVKILITVEGGIVQNINANIDAKIVVIDYDDKGDDPVYISEIMEPNNIVKDNFHSELFQGEIHPSEQIAKETLKELNF